jgi:hypothetical protein
MQCARLRETIDMLTAGDGSPKTLPEIANGLGFLMSQMSRRDRGIAADARRIRAQTLWAVRRAARISRPALANVSSKERNWDRNGCIVGDLPIGCAVAAAVRTESG